MGPELLAFINTFNFLDNLSGVVGSAFATAGSPNAGLQPTLEQINRGLETFRLIEVGGNSWRSAEGVGIVTNGSNAITNNSQAWKLGYEQGARVARVSGMLQGGA